MKNLKFLSLLLLTTIVFWSCSDDDDGTIVIEEQPQNIVELAQSNPNLSSLVAAVVEANLTVTLSGPGPFTVLAPTDEAFAEFMSDNGWNTVADIPDEALEQTLLNHVISGTVTSSDLINLQSGYTSTLASGPANSNISLKFDATNGVMFNSASEVTIPDVMASNGIVHVVDQVITLPTVVDHAVNNSNFSSLVAALGAAEGDLVTVLSGEGPFTVLAPDDAAFTTFLDGADLADVDAGVLSQILLNHVISGAITSTDLTTLVEGYSNTNASGPNMTNLSIYFNTSNGVMFNGSSTVTTADIVGTNGIIHAVDSVIDLPTIATFATSNPALSNLVAALQYADTGMPTVPYINTVSDADAGPFTVFAPTDAAFGDLLTELNANALTDLPTATVDAVLTYHIVAANVQSSQLTSGTVNTLGGNITADATNFTLVDANNRTSNIITTLVDIQATNGVVHAIDKVILPPQ
ncbi:Secreted and surface protein [Mesoflavibacter sp. HG96]|uniref:fasciclin domain-containing protein n=1 Tax=Mesoflavibacter TaxID=444051 RepID=UPI000D0EF20C|nr:MULTISPECIES: fasciclin domain-containing protein [Mesoflavibacter]QIJ89723.1 Secreted and surface protein [Mesoflavibacter sp. HG96]QIJ92451.1 Secreted and surface protein [Mesoflavibacter sp. HG37]